MSATTRLYYTDSTLTEFAAGVVAAEPADGCVAVRLDRTAFYPTSGGQPNDTGSLGSGRVVDVVDREDGTVWHMVEAPPALTVGETVHGQVDWPRRFDHMQQHSGQHVLSAAFAQLCAARTVGFHLGERVSTIDLDRPLSPEQVAGCVRLLSVTPEELVSEIERVQTGQREQRRVTRALQSRLVSLDATSLVAAGQAVGAATVVVSPLAGHDAGSLKAVAVEVVRRPGHIAVLTSDARPVAVVVARAHDVDLDAAAVIRGLLGRWDGRGGGRPEIAQGGGLDADPDEVTELARRLLGQALE